jgi:hypothetical protein
MDDLTSRLESSYAVAAPAMKTVPEGLGFTRVIQVKVEGDIVDAVQAAIGKSKVDRSVLIACHGRVFKADGRKQARQFKGLVERFHFSGQRGPAFLIMGKFLTDALAQEPDLVGRVSWL